MKRLSLIAIYYGINTCAFAATVFGGKSDAWWWPCFILSNVIGMTGTWVLMRLYKVMNVNTATAVTLGGGFLIIQFVVALLFKSRLSVIQYAGVLVIASGLFCMVRGEKKEIPDDNTPKSEEERA
ncbi:MAG: hypothetical protein FWF44_01120 [Defluviitaleaceae bacterium]|nr:hypothetical protein [Defluviitaleaceae bacterium]